MLIHKHVFPLAAIPAVTNVVSTNSIGTNTATRAPRGFGFGGPVTPEASASNFDNCLRRGYAVVTYRYTECGEDNTNFRSSCFYPAVSGI